MRTLFNRWQVQNQSAFLESEKVIQCTNEKNRQALAEARQTADNLNRLLEANHISIQIYKAVGNKKDVRINQSVRSNILPNS
jgi:hypothetical protein